MTTTSVYVLRKRFVGEPTRQNVQVVDFKLPELQDGDIATKAVFFSLDACLMQFSQLLPLGQTIDGGQVAMITQSRNPDFPEGKLIVGNLGWASCRVFNPRAMGGHIYNQEPYLLPVIGGLSPSLALGALGMPGNTAYFGLVEICQPKAGETLIVSGAAGGVGSHVGQIGKILGLKVIGIAGSEEKCKWLVDELKFDHAINYKKEDVAAALKKAAPDGVDCYFDNVGGDISTAVIYQMKERGRVSVCGSISSYNADTTVLPIAMILQPVIESKQLKIESFIVTRWANRWQEGIEKNAAWIREGKLKYRETVTEGFENMVEAFAGMLKGENIGKAIVKA